MKVVQPGGHDDPARRLIELVTETMATAYKVVPISLTRRTRRSRWPWPSRRTRRRSTSLRIFLGRRGQGGDRLRGRRAWRPIERLYAGQQESIQDVVKQIESDKGLSQFVNRNENTIDLEAIEEMADAAPVRKLLNMVLLLAIKDHASDIHFEPFEDEFKMRIESDGVLYEMVPPPRHLAIAITTPHQGHGEPRHRRAPAAAGRPHRAERRRQPGRPARQRAADDVRRERRHAGARPLGRQPRPRTRSAWTPDTLAKFREVIHKPNGIVLVTGPTGSGKTTTLYSALNELNDIDDKLITTEDPVEYDIDGIIQVPDQPRHRRDVRRRACGRSCGRTRT